MNDVVADTQGNGRRQGRQRRPDPSGPGQPEPIGALPLTVGSLFSGIGGFDLGLERAGMRTVWLCEQDPFCRRVLARHWPGVPCYPDVRALVADTRGARRRQDVRGAHGDESQNAGRPAADTDVAGGGGESDGTGAMVPVPVPYVDVLCGGFPCQDISLAGAGAGLAGERSGLWREFARLIGELRPRYVIVENVPALTHRGLDVVLADLAACGFDAEWDHLPASAFGAPHRRDRIWLVAYTNGHGESHGPVDAQAPGDGHASGRTLADADGTAGNGTRPAGQALPRPGQEQRPGRRGSSIGNPWLIEPDVGRVAYGIPDRVDRLRALGNALVPQIAEWIGRQIIQWEYQARHPCPEPAGATRGQ